jgi:hypothetical protein
MRRQLTCTFLAGILGMGTAGGALSAMIVGVTVHTCGNREFVKNIEEVTPEPATGQQLSINGPSL